MLLSRSDDSWQPVLAMGDMVAILLDGRPVAGVALALVILDGHPVVATAGNVVTLSTLFEVIISVVGNAEVNNIPLLELSGAQRSHAEVDDLSGNDGRALLKGSGSGSCGGGQEAKRDGNLGEMHFIDDYALEVFKDECLCCYSGFVAVDVVDDYTRGPGDAMALYPSLSLISSE